MRGLCMLVVFLSLLIPSFSIPKDYSKKPGVSTFRFAKDISAKNYRKQEKCNVNVVLNWKRELQSSCFSTPVLYPFFKDGNGDIIVNGFWQYLDTVKSDGRTQSGWPYSLQDSHFYASPIVADVDNGGIESLILTDSNAHIYVLHLSAKHTVERSDMYTLPDLSVHRQWFELQSDTTQSTLESVVSLPSIDALSFNANTTSGIFDSVARKQRKMKQYQKEKKTFIELDPHILTNPGKYLDRSRLILYLPISYYYSDTDYPDGLSGVSIEKYLACGVTAFDISANRVLWSHIFGLSTISHKAFIYSTPTTVDLEGMGEITTLFGSSQGLLYAVNEKGETRRGFPIRFNEIRMGVVCADITNDAYLEIIVGDMSGILAVLNPNGEEVWSVTLSGALSQSVTIADVDGNGSLDVIAVTDNGDLWVLDGRNGKSLPSFPIRIGCMFRAAPTLLDLSQDGRGLHLLYTSKDGELGIVDLMTGCVRRVDVGEEMVTRVLALKESKDELLALVVSTMNGNLLQFTTSGKWSQTNRFSNRGYNADFIFPRQFITLTYGSGTELWWEIIQNNVLLPITIEDNRPRKYNAFYIVRVYRKGVMLYENKFLKDGSYVLKFELTETGYYNIHIVLENEHKQIIERVVTIHSNVEALNYLKWFLLVPFFIVSLILLLSSSFGTPLPF